jgi:hypothetical protein
MVVAGMVLEQSFTNFPRQVETAKAGVLLFQLLDDPQTLAVMFKTAVIFHQSV